MSAPVDVLEALAGWCSEKGIGKPEYDRRSETYAAVAELIEAAKARRDSVTFAQEREANVRLDFALARLLGAK